MKSKFYWTFRIETSRFGGVLGPSCDYVTDENREAWQRFVENKIRELMKPETMDLPEFKEYLAKVQEEKRKREEYERREKELRIRHADERRLRSSMERPKITYIPKGLTVDYTEEYERLAEQGDYQEAALRFMQMTKSMCRHFVEDEHYNYFDDMYSPEYAIDDLIDLFVGLDKDGKLPIETKEYLDKAWLEIKDTECFQNHGLPRKGIFEP